MIPVTPQIAIEDDEIELRFKRSPGPGGQHVNKVETAVELRFDMGRSEALMPDVKDRLAGLAGRRLTKEGVIVIHADRFRSQERNREDALARLVDLIRRAAVVPTKRRPTKPSRAAREKRYQAKQKRGSVKKLRGRVTDRD
ncbi:MAG: aminoacyl-tRNA hydrolase [Rhodospirillales bacterium]|nr:aminoacyl-tRNA hydrolase [Rhodospirillales bacterium]